MKAVKSKKKGNFFQKQGEIKRSNDLRCRIEAYCKQEKLTRPQFAELLKCSNSQLSSFMTGSALTGSEVYTSGNL